MRNSYQTTLPRIKVTTFWILLLGLLAGAATTVWAEELAVEILSPTGIAASSAIDAPVWTELASLDERSLVQIWLAGEKANAGGQCFIITHGMGGTLSGDSFRQLAAAIHKRFPRTSVIRLDWSEKASAKLHGFLNPWKVAESIDSVGDQAALVFKKEGIDPAHTTFIGESFGNWVTPRGMFFADSIAGFLSARRLRERYSTRYVESHNDNSSGHM